jgi:hypothetical protein
MDPIERLRRTVCGISGMSPENFDLSIDYWQQKTYKKGEFYNEYKNVCKYLGFVLTGVFRIYKFHDPAGVEKNMQFFTHDQFMTSFKSFFSQEPCEYYTESMTESDILYIHYDHLQHLYKTSHAWERFGRIYAQSILHAVMGDTEAILFKSPEARYAELISTHPDIHKSVPLYHIASYLGIEGPSLSRIRKRMTVKGAITYS